MDVSRILPGLVSGAGAPAPATAAREAQGPSFGAVLAESLAQVSSLQQQADRAIGALAAGGAASLHETMLALDRADLSFRLMMQVRDKIVEAYQEVLRMQA